MRREAEICSLRAGDWIPASMPRKRKKRGFSVAKALREMARERVGPPRPAQLIPDRKKKPEKYKPTLGKLMEDQ